MKFAIITHAAHKLKNNHIYAYEPYVREMNLWLKYVDKVRIVAPVSREKVTTIESKYLYNKRHSKQREAISTKEQIATSHTPRNDEKPIKLIEISSFDIKSFKNGLKAISKIPSILLSIYKTMNWADHIHLRCPGNIGLLGCFVQILFPSKPKTIKYAGNWDPKSKQPLSYRIQKWILSNTFLTRNAKVLVYGEWPNQSKNIISFFTASYSEKELIKRHSEQGEAISSNEQIATSHTPRNDKQKQNKQIAALQTPRNDKKERHPELISGSHPNTLNFIYVGGLTPGKKPLLSVQVVHELKKRGYKVQLNIYGDGKERIPIKKYIATNNLHKEIILHGNVSKETIKEAYQKSHFLLFISKSEGWPKVVTEAMFWGCLPISSGVSCIPYMLGDVSRGAIVESDIEEIVSVIENYFVNKNKYKIQAEKAMEWSRQYTLERFEEEIGMLL